MSLGCYLIQTGDGRNVLVDAGLPPGVAPPGLEAAAPARDVVVRPGEIGLRPEDVDLVICTHFDIDHCGRLDAFAHAEFVVQRELREAARSGHPRFAASRACWDRPGLRFRAVDGDAELLPGLDLIETGGHAPGHQSVLVRLPRTGPVLLAVDAAAMERWFAPDRAAGPMDDDEARPRASTQKLIDLAEREGVVLVVFGHDGRQWAALHTAPEAYD